MSSVALRGAAQLRRLDGYCGVVLGYRLGQRHLERVADGLGARGVLDAAQGWRRDGAGRRGHGEGED